MTRFLGDRQRRDLRRATVVGGGVVGLTVAKGLESAGWTVKVVESNERRANEIAQRLKSMVLHGDGTDLELLAACNGGCVPGSPLPGSPDRNASHRSMLSASAPSAVVLAK